MTGVTCCDHNNMYPTWRLFIKFVPGPTISCPPFYFFFILFPCPRVGVCFSLLGSVQKRLQLFRKRLSCTYISRIVVVVLVFVTNDLGAIRVHIYVYCTYYNIDHITSSKQLCSNTWTRHVIFSRLLRGGAPRRSMYGRYAASRTSIFAIETVARTYVFYDVPVTRRNRSPGKENRACSLSDFILYCTYPRSRLLF